MQSQLANSTVLLLCALQLAGCMAEDWNGVNQEVGWGDAAWVTTIAIAFVIVLVGITFFTILILASMRCNPRRLLPVLE